MALDHVGCRLVDVPAVGLVDAHGNGDLGGAIRHAPLLGRQRPVEVTVDQLGDRRDRFVFAVGGVQRVQLITRQMPGFAVAIERMRFGPDLLHVDPGRLAQRHCVHGPPARIAGGIAQEAFVVDTGKQDRAPRIARLGARVGPPDFIMAAGDE
ncbi:hypothetical protein D3C75_588420 [compost metagenome]